MSDNIEILIAFLMLLIPAFAYVKFPLFTNSHGSSERVSAILGSLNECASDRRRQTELLRIAGESHDNAKLFYERSLELLWIKTNHPEMRELAKLLGTRYYSITSSGLVDPDRIAIAVHNDICRVINRS